MEEVFGAAYAKSLAADFVIGALGGRTPAQALHDGVAPKDVWDALCAAMDVPDEQRWAWRAEKPRVERPQNRGY